MYVRSSSRTARRGGATVNNIFAPIKGKPGLGHCNCEPAAVGDAGGSVLGLAVGIGAVIYLATRGAR